MQVTPMKNQHIRSNSALWLTWPVLITCLVATPCWSGPTINESLVSGAEALGRENLDQAIEQFSQAIDTRSDNREQMAAAYEGRCAARYKKSLVGNEPSLTREAIDDCNQAIDHKSDHQRAWRLRGTIHLTLGDPVRALEDLNIAQALDSKDHLTLQNRGLALARLGRTEQAIADFDRAIKLKPGHSWSFYNRGRLYSVQGRHENAIDDFSAFIRFRRDYEPAYLHRGRSYLASGAYQQSLVDLYESLRLKPGPNSEAHFLRGVVLYLLERYDEALTDFEDVRRANDTDTVNAMWLFLTRERLGQPGREAFSGIRDLKEDAQWPGVMVSYMMGRSHAEAVLEAAQANKVTPGLPEETENMAMFLIGELAMLKQQPADGHAWFSRLLQKKPGAPWVHAALWKTRDTPRPEVPVAQNEPAASPRDTSPLIVDPNATRLADMAMAEEAESSNPQHIAIMGQPPTVRPDSPLTSGAPIRSNRPLVTHSPLAAVQPIKISLPTAPPVAEAASQDPEMPPSSEPTKAKRSPHIPGTYAFKLAAYESSEHADQALAELSRIGLPVYLQDFMVKDHTYLRIWVGPFKSEAQANAAWKKVSALPGRNPSSVRKR